MGRGGGSLRPEVIRLPGDGDDDGLEHGAVGSRVHGKAAASRIRLAAVSSVPDAQSLRDAPVVSVALT